MSMLLGLVLAAAPPCVTSLDGGTVITCGESTVLVFLVDVAPAQALPDVAKGLTSVYARTEQRPVEVKLKSKAYAALDISLMRSATDETVMSIALLVAVPEREGVSRVMLCTRAVDVSASHCQSGFESGLLVKNPTSPAFATSSSAPAPWSGATIATPPNCELNEPGSIRCEKATLLWSDAEPGPLNRPSVLAANALQDMPDSMMTARPCIVGGKASTCTLVLGTVRGVPLSAVFAEGLIDGRPTLFQCVAQLHVKDVVPSPCDRVLSFSAAKK